MLLWTSRGYIAILQPLSCEQNIIQQYGWLIYSWIIKARCRLLFLKRVRVFDLVIKTRENNESWALKPKSFIAFECFGTMIKQKAIIIVWIVWGCFMMCRRVWWRNTSLMQCFIVFLSPYTWRNPMIGFANSLKNYSWISASSTVVFIFKIL
jgi:hypothetical protein